MTGSERPFLWRYLQEAEVEQPALGQDLEKGCTLVHAARDEFSFGFGIGPTPGTTADSVRPSGGRSQRGVVYEVVEIDVLATEGMQGVAWDGFGLAVDALGVVKPGVQSAVHQTGLGLG